MSVSERIWRSGSRRHIRVLPGLLGLGNRGYTLLLQRALTDLGLDQSFAASVGKVKEHYGFDVPVSSLRALTH